MTDITLRKAAALQDLIREAKSRVKLSPVSNISIFGDVAVDVMSERDAVMDGVARLGSLNSALAEIRALTARANVASGISDLLAEQAIVADTIAALSPIADAKPYEGDEFAVKRAQRLMGRDEPAGVFGRSSGPIETMQVNVLSETDLGDVQARLKALKKRKIDIRDELAELNAATRIKVSETCRRALETEGLL